MYVYEYVHIYVYIIYLYIFSCVGCSACAMEPIIHVESMASSRCPTKNLLTALPKVQLLSAALPLKKCWMTFLDCR